MRIFILKKSNPFEMMDGKIGREKSKISQTIWENMLGNIGNFQNFGKNTEFFRKISGNKGKFGYFPLLFAFFQVLESFLWVFLFWTRIIQVILLLQASEEMNRKDEYFIHFRFFIFIFSKHSLNFLIQNGFLFHSTSPISITSRE